MIDLAVLIHDPDFCESFVIRHQKGQWQDGVFVTVPEEQKVKGIVEPTSGEDLEQLPEADRISGLMTFYTKEAITLGDEEQLSDEIISRGKVYKVLQVLDWSRHGFYKAIASLAGKAEHDTP